MPVASSSACGYRRSSDFGGHQAVGQFQLARAHALLQRAARHAHQLRRSPDGDPLRHDGAPQPPGSAGGVRAVEEARAV
jgi:hypothetical protein